MIKNISKTFLLLALVLLSLFAVLALNDKKVNADDDPSPGKIVLSASDELDSYKTNKRYVGVKFLANQEVANRTFTPSSSTAIMIVMNNYSSTVKYSYHLNGQLDGATDAAKNHVYKFQDEAYVSSIELGGWAVGALGISSDYNAIVIPTTDFSNATGASFTFESFTMLIRLNGVASSNITYSQANSEIFGIYLLEDFTAETDLDPLTMLAKPLVIPYDETCYEYYDSGSAPYSVEHCIKATYEDIEPVVDNGGVVTDNVLSFDFGADIDLSTVKGISFDFTPTLATSYNVEFTDKNNDVWSTQGAANGLNGDKGSGVLTSKAANASSYFTNVFDAVPAGFYNVYIPFEFYKELTVNNPVINPVYKIKGYDDGLGIAIGETTYDIPELINGVINFVTADNAAAVALKGAISNIVLVTDDKEFTHGALNINPTALTNALTGYNEDASRKTVEFTTKSTMIKWTSGTGMGAGAGLMLKFGNTGSGDVKIRIEISESGTTNPSGVDCMTESYSGSEVSIDEYYVFVHGNNSIKAQGTEEKLYITKRQFTLPAGYQGALLVPFARLRWVAASYITPTNTAYKNGRFDNQLGAIRLYVDNLSDEAYPTNSLTFYVLNVIKAADGLGVSFKSVSSASNISANNASQANVLSTSLKTMELVNNSACNTETIDISTVNTGTNVTKMFVGQTATITASNIEAGQNYSAKLYYMNNSEPVDITDELVLVSQDETSIVYSYRNILQSRSGLTFELSSECKVHTYGEYIETLAATCTEVGSKHAFCTVCTKEDVQEIPAKGHDYQDHAEKDATCTEVGYDAYLTCSRCSYTTYVEIAALGHDYVEHAEKNATCTEVGYDAYLTCSRCDYSSKGADKPALDHNYEWVVDTPATYTATGLKHEECTRCHVTRNENTEIPMKDCEHDLTLTAQVDATCTTAGKKAFYTCSICNGIYEDLEAQKEITDFATWGIINALDHDYQDYAAKDATCTDAGWDSYQTCSRCNYTTYSEKTALGHDYVNHEAKEATCTEAGWDEYQTCSRCNYTTYSEKAELGHSEVTILGKAATCTEKGLTDGKKCSVCQEVLLAQTETDALGHDYVNHDAKAPTCEEAGWDAYQTCSRCDYSSYVEKEALGHIEVTLEAKNPTCTEKGLTEGKKCSACNKILVAQEEIDMVAHSEVTIPAVSATCTKAGSTEGKKCSICGKVLVEPQEVPQTEHSYSEWVVTKEATVDAVGFKQKVCYICGDRVVESIPKLEKPEENNNTGCLGSIAASIFTSIALFGAAGFIARRKKETK